MKKLLVKDIAIISIFGVIVALQEEILIFLPNINFTVFLVVLFSKVFGLYKTLLMILVYVFLDNTLMSSFSPIFTPFMYLGWAIIPSLLNTVFKNVNKTMQLALLGILFSFVYCWVYIIPNALILKINIIAYLASDILFEILMALSSFITILWLYEPSAKALKKLYSSITN